MTMPFSLFSSKPLSTIKYTIAIAAGKGGVGKSTVTVNIALALAHAGYQVGILDTDLYGPSARKMLPEQQLPRQEGDIIFPALCNGIKMISMAYFCRANEAFMVRAPIANGLISQFVNNVAWGDLDFLLIDFPPGTGDIQLTLSQKAQLDGAVMVTTPQEVAVMDVRKAIYLFNQVKVPIIGIVENMSYYLSTPRSPPVYLFGKGGGDRLAQEVGVSLLGEIPIDPELCKSGDEGRSLWNGKPNLAVDAFNKIAEKLLIEAEKIRIAATCPQYSQIDKNSIVIHWNKGEDQIIVFDEIQKNCGCAHCVDESSGQRLIDPNSIKKGVGVTSINLIGHYGLQFQFTSGCSTGIYSFDRLREIGRKNS
jgi:ATP-binding protein involved in chromosome partitioning